VALSLFLTNLNGTFIWCLSALSLMTLNCPIKPLDLSESGRYKILQLLTDHSAPAYIDRRQTSLGPV
jgi:hypothetical protein